jgi:hypothetical protein
MWPNTAPPRLLFCLLLLALLIVPASAGAAPTINGLSVSAWSSNAPASGLGSSLTQLDMNGDGITDHAVEERTLDQLGDGSRIGRIDVILGGFSQLASPPASGGLISDFGAQRIQINLPYNEPLIGTVQGADIDKDGYSDLIISDANNIGIGNHVYIVWGSAAPADVDLTIPSPAFTDLTVDALMGAGNYGLAACAGDFNGDSNVDLAIIGAGNSQDSLVIWLPAGRLTSQDSSLLPTTRIANVYGTCAASDLNADGVDDLITGSGIVYGHPGPWADFDMAAGAPSLARFVYNAPLFNFQEASHFALGDLDHDGQQDLVVSDSAEEG